MVLFIFISLKSEFLILDSPCVINICKAYLESPVRAWGKCCLVMQGQASKFWSSSQCLCSATWNPVLCLIDFSSSSTFLPSFPSSSFSSYSTTATTTTTTPLLLLPILLLLFPSYSFFYSSTSPPPPPPHPTCPPPHSFPPPPTPLPSSSLWSSILSLPEPSLPPPPPSSRRWISLFNFFLVLISVVYCVLHVWDKRKTNTKQWVWKVWTGIIWYSTGFRDLGDEPSGSMKC